MKIEVSNVPQVQGFYFVKEKSKCYWQLLVEVIGVAPFMVIEKIHVLFSQNDRNILQDLVNLDWSDVIEVVAESHEPYYGVWITNTLKDQLIYLIRSEGKLSAIKHMRVNTGLGLQEAKDYCDVLHEQIRKEL